jgi:AhpC/TSA family
MRVAPFVMSFAAMAAIASCERDPGTTTSTLPPAALASASPAPTTSAPPPAWLTDRATYSLINTSAPAFEADLNGGGKTSAAALRGHWTILAFWGLWSDDSLADAKYMRALVSAADADPDLDFLSISSPPGPGRAAEALGSFPSLDAWFKSQGGSGWPTAMDPDGKIAAVYHVTAFPTYFLIGPDLTIEAGRGELSATPEDGIKPVIRGYSEIRKQVVSPN